MLCMIYLRHVKLEIHCRSFSRSHSYFFLRKHCDATKLYRLTLLSELMMKLVRERLKSCLEDSRIVISGRASKESKSLESTKVNPKSTESRNRFLESIGMLEFTSRKENLSRRNSQNWIDKKMWMLLGYMVGDVT